MIADVSGNRLYVKRDGGFPISTHRSCHLGLFFSGLFYIISRLFKNRNTLMLKKKTPHFVKTSLSSLSPNPQLPLQVITVLNFCIILEFLSGDISKHNINSHSPAYTPHLTA